MENTSQNREQSDLEQQPNEKEQLEGLKKPSEQLPDIQNDNKNVIERGIPKQKTHKELHMENVISKKAPTISQVQIIPHIHLIGQMAPHQEKLGKNMLIQRIPLIQTMIK